MKTIDMDQLTRILNDSTVVPFEVDIGCSGIRGMPWKGGKERMAVAKAFAVFSLPFVLAELFTGAASILTGELSIPPSLGAGTAVDIAILLTGVIVAFLNGRRRKSAESKSAHEGRES